MVDNRVSIRICLTLPRFADNLSAMIRQGRALAGLA
jgi:hypothetical protein